ncbi:zinc-ribbon domain-containing protein [Paenibacillus sp. MMS18-CY102]|uniref:zinc-ribbon domain-containing protein n=1 Tax=Paenibacillus sp. MMS18-CY102 TaxID=2682849 RepID=UPI001366420B|nr:zinc-ribbon domain-containing protein [Paenibacillus sp. MMS18-CY102]
MYCSSCGAHNDSAVKFCASCGAPVESKAAEGQGPNRYIAAAAEQPSIALADSSAQQSTAPANASSGQQVAPVPGSRKKMIMGIAAIAIIVIAAYIILGKGSTEVAYKGVSLGDELETLKDKLGPAKEINDDMNENGVKLYEYENNPQFMVKDGKVVGIYLDEDDYELENGITSGESTLNDIIKAYGKGKLHNSSEDGGSYVVYKDSKTVIAFEMSVSGDVPHASDEVGEIQAMRIDMIDNDQMVESIEEMIEPGALKYKK